MAATIVEKVCKDCKRTFPATPEYFHRNKNYRDGFVRQCKSCVAASYASYYHAKREPRLAVKRTKYHANPEQGRAIVQAWRDANPEKNRAVQRKHHDGHREQLNERLRLQRAAEPERFLEYGLRARQNFRKRWPYMTPEEQEKHLAYMRYHVQAYRARMLSAPINDVTLEQRQAVIDAAGGVCVYCAVYKPACKACQTHSHKLTVDHITALAVGGSNTLHNLIACCQSCNSRKRISPPPLPVQPLLLAVVVPSKKKVS